MAVVDRRVLGDVRDERALSHGRPCCEHDQVARLEAAGQLVDVLEARRRARDRDALARDLLELRELVVEDGLDRADIARAIVVRDLVERGLRALEQLVGLAGEPVDVLLDAAGRVEQPTQHRMLLDDAPVVPRVRRCGHKSRQRVDVGRAARLLELARARQLVADREGVDWLRLRLLLQADHRPEDLPVALAVEVLGLQLDVDQEAIERLLREQDRTEDRNLCFLVLRRDVACIRPG